MKPSYLQLGLLGLTVAAGSASAQTLNYSTGDLMVAFRETGKNDVVVNLGNAASFLSSVPEGTTVDLTPRFQYDLGNAFNQSFGNGVGVVFSVFGNAGAGSNPVNTSYLTARRDDPEILANPLLTVTTSVALGNKSAIEGMMGIGKSSGILFQDPDLSQTLTTIDPASGNSYTTQFGSSTLKANYPTIESTAVPSGGAAVSDLYQVDRSGVSPKPNAAFAGYFTLTAAGNFSYTAVPEPSTYALAALGLAFGGLFLRRRAPRA